MTQIPCSDRYPDHDGTYDYAVIGGGPAGTTFARLAGQRGLRVLLIDRRVNGTARGKPCGGLLAPDAQKVLAGFGLTLPKELLVDPQIFSVKTIDVCRGIVRFYPRFYLNLDREHFDRWLLSLVPPEVTVIGGSCTGIRREGEEFLVTAGETSYRARRIVGADGASSLVRKLFFPHRKLKKYLAIQEWFRAPGDVSPFYSCVFDAKTSESCSWSIGKDDCFLFGGAFSPKGCRDAFREQKRRAEALLGLPLTDPIRTEACEVARPCKPSDFVTGEHGVFLVGEAAGFISPSSFEGISSALISAAALADSIEAKAPERTYRRKTRALRIKLLAKTVKRPWMYHPALRYLVMRSGVSSIRVRSGEHP